MKTWINLFVFLFLLVACNTKTDEESIELITDSTQQEILFRNISSLVNEPIVQKDSVAFLLLPIQAICPSCRKKIIDSIVSNQNKLDSRHFIIISANGGKKTMEAFFRERGHTWPDIKDGLFLDTTNQAFKNGLYKDKPVFFYGYKQRISRKVSSVPATVKDDLRFFFSKAS